MSFSVMSFYKYIRGNNIVDDDQDLISTELTYMIDFLCTS